MNTAGFQHVHEDVAARVRVYLEAYSCTVSNVMQITGGSVNETFYIETDVGPFIVRVASHETTLDHLLFEVDILRQLTVPYVAKLIPTRDGELFVVSDGKFITVQTVVPGSVKASWNNLATFSDKQLHAHCAFAGRFVHELRHVTSTHGESLTTLAGYVEQLPAMFDKVYDALPHALIPDTDTRHALDALLRDTDKDMRAYGYDELPKQVVHFDLHPGNVHFGDDDTVVGVFDFDWARRDTWITDFCSSIQQTCYVFGGADDGVYPSQRIGLALRAFRDGYGPSGMTYADEQNFLRMAMQGYTLFQLYWSCSYAASHPHDVEINTQYIQHFIHVALRNDFRLLFATKQ